MSNELSKEEQFETTSITRQLKLLSQHGKKFGKHVNGVEVKIEL